MSTKRQKTNLPVIGHVVHHHVVPRGRRIRAHRTGEPLGPRELRPYGVDLKYAPLIDTGKTYRGESNAKLARRLLRDLRRMGAA